jgi:transposase
MNIVTVGINLAKNVFALHGVDQSGKAVLIKPKVVRGQLLEMVAHLPRCLIGMEACSGAHYWAREFSRFGHTVKLMAPKFVAPYPRVEPGKAWGGVAAGCGALSGFFRAMRIPCAEEVLP